MPSVTVWSAIAAPATGAVLAGSVVTETSFDHSLIPAALVAATRSMLVVSGSRPLCMKSRSVGSVMMR